MASDDMLPGRHNPRHGAVPDGPVPKPPSERGWAYAGWAGPDTMIAGVPFGGAEVHVGPIGAPLDEGGPVTPLSDPGRFRFGIPDRTREVDATFENEVRPR